MSYSKTVLFAWLNLLLAATALAGQAVGRVALVNGDVLINGQQTTVGAVLSMGDVVETREGKCTLLLGKETVVHLDLNAKLRLTQQVIDSGVEKTTLDLSYGRT